MKLTFEIKFKMNHRVRRGIGSGFHSGIQWLSQWDSVAFTVLQGMFCNEGLGCNRIFHSQGWEISQQSIINVPKMTMEGLSQNLNELDQG